jgi:hypothetical protein
MLQRTNTNRRSRNNARRPQLTRPLDNTSRALLTALSDLTKVTQDKFLPAKRDVPPRPIPSRDRVYSFERTYSAAPITSSNAGDTGSIQFTLDSLPGYTDFTALFDQYRIRHVRIQCSPLAAPFGQSTTATSYPTVYTVIDYDDASVPTSVTQLQQFDTLMVTPNAQSLERHIAPRPALAAYSGSVFTAFASSPNTMWIDSNNVTVPYYGFKWATDGVTTVSGSYQLLSVNITVSLECRHPL